MADDLKTAKEHRRLTAQQIRESVQRIRNMIKEGKLKDLEIKYGVKGIVDSVLGDSFVQDYDGLVPPVGKMGGAASRVGKRKPGSAARSLRR